MNTAFPSSLLTFVIPVGSYHTEAAEKAVFSCLAQSVRCNVVVVYDRDQCGAGWARNRGLEHVHTPFVSFLDADDWVTPDFAEKCLRAYDGRHYVYTDWVTDRLVQAPCKAWDGRGSAHIITTLLPTVFVRHVGGFDETTQGEDTAFYWKLTRAGLCGKRLPEALFHYGKGGKRAQALRDDPNRDAILKRAIAPYLEKPMPCTDCGGNDLQIDVPPSGDKEADDVLAESLWMGNRQERGRATGRTYPRTGNHKKLWVDPRDIDAAPHLFARVIALPPPVHEDDLQAFKQFSGQVRTALNGGVRDTTQDPVPAYVEQREVQPDVAQVLRLYAQNT